MPLPDKALNPKFKGVVTWSKLGFPIWKTRGPAHITRNDYLNGIIGSRTYLASKHSRTQRHDIKKLAKKQRFLRKKTKQQVVYKPLEVGFV